MEALNILDPSKIAARADELRKGLTPTPIEPVAADPAIAPDPNAPAVDAATPEAEATPAAEGEEEATPAAVVPFDAEHLDQFLESKPELKAVIEKDPALKEQLAATMADAKEAQAFREVVPDVESAKFAVQQAQDFTQFDTAFRGSVTPEGTQNFLVALAERCTVADPATGQPMRDQYGNVVMSPDYQGFMENFGSIRAEQTRSLIDSRLRANQYSDDRGRERDEAMLAAWSVIEEGEKSLRGDPTADMPENLRKQAEQIKTERSRLEGEKTKATQQATVAFDQAVTKTAAERITGQIDSMMAAANVTGMLADGVRDRAYAEAMKVITKNDLLRSELRDLANNGDRSQAAQDKRVAKIMAYAQRVLPGIAGPLITQANQDIKSRQTTRDAQNAARTKANRSEVPASTATPSPNPGGTMTAGQAYAAAKAELSKGDMTPSDQQIMARAQELRQAGR